MENEEQADDADDDDEEDDDDENHRRRHRRVHKPRVPEYIQLQENASENYGEQVLYDLETSLTDKGARFVHSFELKTTFPSQLGRAFRVPNLHFQPTRISCDCLVH